MAEDRAVTIYSSTAITDGKKNPFSIKVGMAQMLRDGAILDEQAKLAEDAGACFVIVSEPPNWGGITRVADPSLIKEIKCVVNIPVMARSRVGHFVEAQILKAIGVNYIDENEARAMADKENFINKHDFIFRRKK